jgi:VWFA-related protein
VSRLCVVSLLVLTAVALQAQDQPTFRTGANYVRVDMYASVDGKSIEDLTAEEVEVLEDNVPQKLEAFEHVQVRPAGPQETRREPNTVEQSRQMAAEGRARVFVIFLDTYHTSIEGSANMRLPLIKFLDRLLGPDDMVALMTPEMGASEITLGRKTTVISNIMQAQWMWGRKGRLVDDDPKEEQYQQCYGIGAMVNEMKARRREKLTLDALSDLMVHLGGIREERKALVVVTEGWQLFRANPNLTSDDGRNRARPEDVFKRTPRPTPADSGTSTAPDSRAECEADRVALAGMDHTQRLREITDDANRGNVTFYPVYARGLVAFDAPIGPDKPPSIRDDQANLRVKQDGLRFLADSTDGTAIVNTNNIDGMLTRIVDDLSSYYLFGYYSTNTKLDGRFRNITVRVKRPGAKVRARRGYRGRTADELISGAAGAPAIEAAAAATTALTPVVSFNARSQFRIRTSSWARQATGGEPSGGAFWVVGELDYRTRRELAWTSTAKADVVILAADGSEVMSRTIDVKTDDGPFGFSVPDSGGLPAGEYAVRVKLTSTADGSLALSDTVRVVLSPTQTLGEAVMWRRGPTTGPQHRRTADPRFQRSDRLRFEHATTLSEPVKARLLDRNGNPLSVPVQVSERPDQSGNFQWIVVDAALAPFAPGDYAIEVTQGTAKQVTGFRIVP